MPEQPADPLHYDMKIPPETHHSERSNDAERHDGSAKPPADNRTHKSDTAKDTNVVRGDDKPQSVPHSE